MRRILKKYVRSAAEQDMVFDVPPVQELYSAIEDEIVGSGYWHLVERWVPVSCHAAHLMYPYRSKSSRTLLAMINTVALYADDTLANSPEPLLNFHLNLVLHRPQSDPVIEWFNTEQLPKLWEEFEPVVAGLIADSFHAFINGTLIETATKTMKFNPTAPFFSDYVRLKSGIPEVYSFFVFQLAGLQTYIQAIPDVIVFINFGNDILSFYKEQLAGEDNNFVHMRAKSSGRSLADTLEELVEESLVVKERVEKTLEPFPEHLTSWRQFVKGYIDFHSVSSRYRLRQLYSV